uniref:Capsid protein n=1 Tax=Cressdnaviricota sp. TaxID=2748378 RepID=A0A6M3YPJ8_9VIRU|nr:MAG: capsid protein [Cressdnaviricota sp.]QJI53691.1 MAG: capsid protein [Cressdnaviricota sp.]QKN88873.1 MAG: capsid protein [Cressdnaviricota sp.]
MRYCDCGIGMRLRSGRVVGAQASVVAPKNTTVVIKRTRKKKLPKTLKGLKKALEGSYTEKKRFEFGRSVNTTTSAWSNYLIGSELVVGPTSFDRIGDSITLTRIYVKFQCSYTTPRGTVPAVGATLSPGGPAYVYAFIVETTRTDDPRTYWFQGRNSDANIDFATATADAAGDEGRFLLKINKRECRILAKKRVVLSPRTDTDPAVCSHHGFSISTKKLRKKMHWNTTPTATVPYANTSVRPNIWVIWYSLQPDVTASRGVVKMSLEGTMYYHE